MANEIEKRNEAFLIYQDENGIARVNVRFEGEDVWLTVEQIMELFDASQQDVSYHVNQIYAEGEQEIERTHKKFLLVRQEGKRSVRRQMSHYNLDMIIAVGYRVKSQVATRFRQWATMHLHEFIQKGFMLDDDRLKGNRSRYFRELLQRIRDIRSSERNLYQQVTDIFATSIDYDPQADLTRLFFATVQNKLHYAAHQHTAAEVIYERVADKVGSTAALLKFAIADDATEFIVATESGILHEMQKRCPEKTFIPAPPNDSTCACNECNYMKLVTMEKLYNCLRYEWPTVEVDSEIAKRAIRPINRMLEISARLGL